MRVWIYTWAGDDKVQVTSDTDSSDFGTFVAEALEAAGPGGDVTIFSMEA